MFYDESVRTRCIEIAEYMIKNGATVRGAAVKFGVGKSTVHKDLTQRLKDFDSTLFSKIKTLLATNKAQRHLRGGEATKRKYKN